MEWKKYPIATIKEEVRRRDLNPKGTKKVLIKRITTQAKNEKPTLSPKFPPDALVKYDRI